MAAARRPGAWYPDTASRSDDDERMDIDYATALHRLTKAYDGIDRLVAALTRDDLLEFSRCRGWVVADVLFHVLCDAQRALIALASPHPGLSDRDFVTYWRGLAGDRDPIPGTWSIKRSAAAFRDGLGSIALWQETSPAAVRAAGAADPNGHVTTQGHVLAVPDFLMTLATEAAIHHLDMTLHLPTARQPHPDALAAAVDSLDGLARTTDSGAGAVGDTMRPTTWTAEQYVLKATGREALSAGEATQARGYPLLS
jgi:Mycothiol maleylpyruvate isomerase N-terminal domain